MLSVYDITYTMTRNYVLIFILFSGQGIVVGFTLTPYLFIYLKEYR
jgi:hypothetical protein